MTRTGRANIPLSVRTTSGKSSSEYHSFRTTTAPGKTAKKSVRILVFSDGVATFDRHNSLTVQIFRANRPEMKTTPLYLLAALPLLLLAADDGPKKHEVSLNVTGLAPQFLNRETGNYTIVTLPDHAGKDTILLDTHTGRTWVYFSPTLSSKDGGWLPLTYATRGGPKYTSQTKAAEYNDLRDRLDEAERKSK